MWLLQSKAAFAVRYIGFNVYSDKLGLYGLFKSYIRSMRTIVVRYIRAIVVRSIRATVVRYIRAIVVRSIRAIVVRSIRAIVVRSIRPVGTLVYRTFSIIH
jgi:hypothetical protein